MTNIDYKSLYEDAYKRAKNLDSPFYRDAAAIIFPELKDTFMENQMREAVEYAICSATHEDGTLVNGITREQALEYLKKLVEGHEETNDPPYEENDITDKLIADIRASLECKLKEGHWPISDKDKKWSEEDTNNLNRIIEILVNGSNVQYWWKKERLISKEEMETLTDWLKTLRPQPKLYWSKEDDLFQHNIIAYLEFRKDKNLPEDTKYPVLDSWINWLKNIRYRQYWKPTEEQLRAVFDASERNDKLGSVLRNLYEELRKLNME